MGNFYGIPGIKFISHGEWSDPEVEYKGYTFNYWDIEDSLYDLFKQEFEPYEDDLYVNRDTGEVLSFEDWLNQNKDLVYSELDDFVAFSKYDYDDIADDDYFDDDGWEIDPDNYEYDYELNESKKRYVEMNVFGYETKTTFWEDFSIADRFGVNAIRDTYNRAFNEWKDDVEYLTELVMVLNWKIWQWYEKDEKIAKVYNTLYEKTNRYALSHLKGDDLTYFYRTTD